MSPGLRQSETIEAGLSLARGLDVPLRLVTVARPEDLDNGELRQWLDSVEEKVADFGDGQLPAVSTEVLSGADVVQALVDAGGDDGLMVVGSSRDWVVRQNLFGAFADEIANRARCAVVMVHSPETMPVSLWRQAVGYLRLGGPRRDRFARVRS